jgi:hypothetical protein
MELKLADVDPHIDERRKRLAQVKALVDESAPEPVLRGTDVPVHVVAALARTQSYDNQSDKGNHHHIGLHQQAYPISS